MLGIIGHVEGIVLKKSRNELLVKTSAGLGMQLYCLKNFEEGEDVAFFTSHIVREQGEELYAHDGYQEKLLFEKLLKVKGVGPKLAYNIVFQLGVHRIFGGILSGDQKLFEKVPGVGKKSSAQILLDLKNKISPEEKKLAEGADSSMVKDSEIAGNSLSNISGKENFKDEIFWIFEELGYKKREIERPLDLILAKGKNENVEETVKSLLKELV